MNTQMNPTDAEIAGRLKLMPRIASVSVGINPYGSVEVTYGGNFMPFKPSDLLALCRAVVERVDGEPIVMNTPRYSPAPRTFFTVEEIREWILGELIYDGNGNEPEMFKEKNRHTRFLAGYLDDKEDGIAATTDRHRKEQG